MIDRVCWDVATLPACPLSYTVELTYTLLGGKVIHDRAVYGLDRETAQRWAESRAAVYRTLILAFPAIPYTLPYVPVVVGGTRPDSNAEAGYTTFTLDHAAITTTPECH